MTESFRTRDGRTLTYRREGEGPILVCHPGGPGFSSRYLADLAGLGESFTLVLLNPRGTADSSAPADVRAYTAPDYVADVEELRAHLGEKQLNVLGHSHGGAVAAAYAAKHPVNVRRMILANSLARFHPEEMQQLMQTHAEEAWYEDARRALDQESAGEFADDDELRELALREFPLYFRRYDDRARAYLEEFVAPERPNPNALKLFNEHIETWDMRPDLSGIEARTLVLTGDADFICGPACAEDFVQGIAGAEGVLLDDCGHFSFVEQPDAFRAAVESFLT